MQAETAALAEQLNFKGVETETLKKARGLVAQVTERMPHVEATASATAAATRLICNNIRFDANCRQQKKRIETATRLLQGAMPRA